MRKGTQHIFFVGIKGVAMANLALMYQRKGKMVSGSDVEDTYITDPLLRQKGIHIFDSFAPQDLPTDVDVVVYAASHGGKNNPQVQEAIKRGITVLHQAELLSYLMREYDTSIAIAGCHGKTTTTSLLAHALKKLGKNVASIIGAPEITNDDTDTTPGSRYIVVEADEYGMDPPQDMTPKFHLIAPDLAIITNVDHDHPDVYPTIDDVKQAYVQFMQLVIRKAGARRCLFLCGDDPALRELAKQLPAETFLWYGTGSGAQVRIDQIETTPQGTRFTVTSAQFALDHQELTIALFGKKNALNAAGVVAVLLQLQCSVEDIRTAIAGFTGAKRRFELVYRQNSTYLFDDYAHHPAEIRATIEAARNRFPGKKLFIIFQPHTYSRTRLLENEFVEALRLADDVALLPVFASAREKKTADSIGSEDLAQRAHEQGVDHIHSFEDPHQIILYLAQQVKAGDVLFTMGAGDVYKMETEIRAVIAHAAP